MGRVGAAVAARLDAQALLCRDGDPDLILISVPDRAIADVARAQPVGPWVAHVSGATPLAALAPHALRFSMHPLQTFVPGGGPSQLDGAWAAVAAETEAGQAR